MNNFAHNYSMKTTRVNILNSHRHHHHLHHTNMLLLIIIAIIRNVQ